MTSHPIPQFPSSGAGDRWPAHRPAVSHRNLPPRGCGWTKTSAFGWSAPPPHPPGAWRCTVSGSARRPPCGPGRGSLPDRTAQFGAYGGPSPARCWSRSTGPGTHRLPPGPGECPRAGSGRVTYALATARYDDGGDTWAGRLRTGRPHQPRK